MPSKEFSALLIEEGVVAAQKVEEAYQRQIMFGGRLGTNLLEVGAVDEETLLIYLAKAAGLPWAHRELLVQPQWEALQILDREQVQRHHLQPLAFHGKRLVVVVTDLLDPGLQAALTSALGHPLEPYITSDFRFYDLQARLHGVPLEPRFAKLAERYPLSDAPARSEGAVDEGWDDLVADLPEPEIPASFARKPSGVRRAAAPDLAPVLAQAPVMVQGPAPASAPAPAAASPVRDRDPASLYLDLRDAIEVTTSRNEALRHFVDFAAGIGRRCMLFRLGRDRLRGVILSDQVAVGAPLGYVDVPFSGRGDLGLVARGNSYYQGPPEAPELVAIYRALGKPLPLEVLLVPIQLGAHVVALALIDREATRFDDDLTVLFKGVYRLGSALERLFREQQASGRPASDIVEPRGPEPSPLRHTPTQAMSDSSQGARAWVATTAPRIAAGGPLALDTTHHGRPGLDRDMVNALVELEPLEVEPLEAEPLDEDDLAEGELIEPLDAEDDDVPEVAFEPLDAGRPALDLQRAAVPDEGFGRAGSRPRQPALRPSNVELLDDVDLVPESDAQQVARPGSASSFPSSEDLEGWADLLDSRDADISANAVEALSRPSPRAVATLMQRFPGRLRLYRLNYERDMPPAARHSRVLACLVAQGELAGQALVEALYSSSNDERFYGLLTLIDLRSAALTEHLWPLLFDKDPQIRFLSLRNLRTRVRNPAYGELVARLAQEAGGDDERRALTALGALAELRNVEFMHLIVPLVEHPNRRIAEAAQRALSAMGLDDVGSSVKKWEKWLAASDSAVPRIQRIADAMVHKDRHVRVFAAEELAEFPGMMINYHPDAHRRERQRAREAFLEWSSAHPEQANRSSIFGELGNTLQNLGRNRT